MTGPMKHVFVIIVNFRTGQLTVQCLASLAADVSSLGSGRVIVVDNCSEDDSVTPISTAIRENGWRHWAELLPMPRNGGFAYGNNAAIARARQLDPDLAAVVLLNPDAVVRPGALADLMQTADLATACRHRRRCDRRTRRRTRCVSARDAVAARRARGRRRICLSHPAAVAPCRLAAAVRASRANATGCRAPAWRSGARCSMRSARSTKASSSTSRRSTSAVARAAPAGRAGSLPTRASCISRAPRPASRRRGSVGRPTGSRRDGASS